MLMKRQRTPGPSSGKVKSGCDSPGFTFAHSVLFLPQRGSNAGPLTTLVLRAEKERERGRQKDPDGKRNKERPQSWLETDSLIITIIINIKKAFGNVRFFPALCGLLYNY